MIMLVTALLISGGASAVLISEWSNALRTVQVNEQASATEDGVDVALAGDPAMVAYDATLKTITLYFVNTGEFDLDTTSYEVLIDGSPPTSTSESVQPSGADWNPGYLLEITLTDTSWSFSDGDDVSVYFIGISESINGYTHSATTNAEVRLNAV
jgi:archaellum component FlaG (FlaF/FlaG flagellin family)